MKTSNKLLLAGFLLVVVLITTIHISLYAKYKAGDFTVYHGDEEILPMQTFPNILFVSMHNLDAATVRFSDSTQVEKREEADIQYVQNGDSLVITNKQAGNSQNFHYPLEVTLPHNVKLSLYNSSVSFLPGKRNIESNLVIYLQKSAARFSGNPFQLGNVKVHATDSSTVLFHGNTQVNNLDVQLSNSTIEYGEGDFGQLSIATDSASRISLQSKHLLKAAIKTISAQ